MLSKLQTLSTWLLPRLCVGCGFSANNNLIDLCEYCKPLLPWLDNNCYQCGGQLSKPNEGIICAKCQLSPPPFNRLCALFHYQQPIIRLISSLKFGRQLYPGALFGQLLSVAAKEQWYVGMELPEIIIPVPLHSRRQRARGYNQAAEICLPLVKNLGIPLDLDICQRIKYTTAQSRLNKAQRTRNLSSAFAANNRKDYRHVAVVDDVVTTGSTIRAVSLALQLQGVEQIDIWSVSRA